MKWTNQKLPKKLRYSWYMSLILWLLDDLQQTSVISCHWVVTMGFPRWLWMVNAWQVLELQWEWELPWVALVLSFWTATDPLCAVNSRFDTAPEIFNRSLKFHEFSRVPEAWFDVVVQMFQCEFQRTYSRYSNPSILANLVGCQLVSYRVYLLTTYK